MKTPQERKHRRDNRRSALGAILDRVRPLDDDDREALTILIKRAAEILGDGELSTDEVDELRDLLGALVNARRNTPDDLRGLADREQ